MPQCEECEHEIDHVLFRQTNTEYGRVDNTREGMETHVYDSNSHDDRVYYCPECETEFEDYDEVVEFLREGEPLPEPQNVSIPYPYSNRHNVNPPVRTFDASQIIGKTFDEAKYISNESESEFIQTLQDNDLWFCRECSRIAIKGTLVRIDGNENDRICNECAGKISLDL